MYNLHKVWDDVPFFGKTVVFLFVTLHVGAIITWLSFMKKEIRKHKGKLD